MQQLSPIGWALRPIKNYANFSGRASRAEFWWFFLFLVIIYMVSVALMAVIGFGAASGSKPSLGLIGAFGIAWIFVLLFGLAMIIPSIAVQVRRLHDTDRSGWWIGGFYLAYIVYMVIMFRMMASFVPTNGSPPDLSPFSGLGVMSYVGFGFFVYQITLLVFFCLGGTKGPNRYGDDPYGRGIEEVFA